MLSWFKHYCTYDFLALDFEDNHPHANDQNREMKEFIMDEMALMMGIAKPTVYEKIMEHKRLDVLGFRERLRRKNVNSETPPAASIPPRATSGGAKALTQMQMQAAAEAEEKRVRREQKTKRLLAIPIMPTNVIKDSLVIDQAGPALATARSGSKRWWAQTWLLSCLKR